MSKNVASKEPDAERWVRDIAPSNYILKIESFSSLTELLSDYETPFYMSKKFEANGYKWIFSIYPSGKADSKGRISMFLRIEDTDGLPLGWKIYADLKFFILDQKQNKYCIFQDGGVNKFHRLKPECGIANLIPRDVFDDAKNGYLVHNECVFGVEVVVLDSKFVGEYLSPALKVDKTFNCYSDEFMAGSD